MAATITATASPRIQITSANTLAGGATNPISIPFNVDDPQGGVGVSFANGSGAAQVSIGFADVRAYAAAPTTLDLSGLSAAATNTGAAAFAGIKALKLVNYDSTNAVTIGGAAATQFAFQAWSAATTTFVLKAGASAMFVDQSAAGMTVSGSIKSLKIDPGSNTVSVGVYIAGI